MSTEHPTGSPPSPGNPPPNQQYTLPPPTQNQPPTGLPPRRKKKSNPVLAVISILMVVVVIGALLFLGLALITGIGAVSGGGGGENIQEKVVSKGTTGKKIVIVPVVGIIHSGPASPFMISAASEKIISRLRMAADDPDVVAVILDMNTPGGEVTATDEIHHELQKLRANGIKVYTCMRSLAASGGYYLAAGTDHIVANRMTLTGSIGVMMGGYNYHGLLDKIGVEQRIYHRGAMKDLGNPARDPDPADPIRIKRNSKEADIIQQLVDETYNEFTKVVATGRKLPLEKVQAPPIGDSRILSGLQAKELGLIDAIGYMEDSITAARNGAQHEVVRYQAIPSLFDLLSAKAETPGMLEQMLPVDERFIKRGRLYYLSPALR